MTNFEYKKKKKTQEKKNQDAHAIEQGSSRRSEVDREQSTWTSTQPAILHISD